MSPQDQCAELARLHAVAVETDRHAGREATARTVAASLDAHAQLDAACEAVRRAHYPRAGKIVAAFGSVYVMSPGGRRITRVYPE